MSIDLEKAKRNVGSLMNPKLANTPMNPSPLRGSLAHFVRSARVIGKPFGGRRGSLIPESGTGTFVANEVSRHHHD
jgi:hypothetical protein